MNRHDGTEVLKQDIDVPLYATRKQAARLLNISVRKLDYMVARDEIEVVRFGKAVRIPRAQILNGGRRR